MVREWTAAFFDLKGLHLTRLFWAEVLAARLVIHVHYRRTERQYVLVASWRGCELVEEETRA